MPLPALENHDPCRPLLPWDREYAFPARDSEEPFGYLDKKLLTPCSEETLHSLCAWNPPLLVWTRDYDRLLPPTEVLELKADLHLAHRRTQQRAWQNELFYAAVFLGLSALIGSLMNELPWEVAPGRFMILLAFLMGFLPAFLSLKRLRGLPHEPTDAWPGEQDLFWARVRGWLAVASPPRSKMLAWVFVSVWLLQMFIGVGDSIESAALVKSAVAEGEYWRLLTSAVMHGSMLHIFFNFGAFAILASFVERLTSFSVVPVIFVVSAVIGNIASCLFLPDTTSVGASGGIFGLLGFWLALSTYHRDLAHTPMRKTVLYSCLFALGFGLLGFELIDNAAHLGGFLAGFLLVPLLVSRTARVPIQPGPAVRILAPASLCLLLAAVVVATYQMYLSI